MKVSVQTNEAGSNHVFTSQGHAKNWPTQTEAIAYGMGYQRGYQEAINRLGATTVLAINGKQQ